MPALWADTPLVLRISLDDKEVTCLISRRALKEGGAVIDLSALNLTLAKHNGSVPLQEVSTGHVAVRLIDVEKTEPDTWPSTCYDSQLNGRLASCPARSPKRA